MENIKNDILSINESLLDYYNLQNDHIIRSKLESKFDLIEQKMDVSKNPNKFIYNILYRQIALYYQSIKYRKGEKALKIKITLDKLFKGN